MATSQFMLPKRNSGTHLKGCSKQTLKTNLFKVEFADKSVITIYSLSTDPSIPPDSQKLGLIVDSAKRQLRENIGNYLLIGKMIFGCKNQNLKNRGNKQNIKIETSYQKQNYVMTIKPVRTIDLSDLYSSKQADTYLPLNFFNSLIKKYLSSMKLVSLGKNGKYFDPQSRHVLSSAGIILFNGYQTKMTLSQGGLYLQIESIVKIVQSRSVLEEIDILYKKNSSMTKEEKRSLIKLELIGKAVMANYGRSKIWVIKDIIFDFDLEKTRIGPQNSLNFIQYYQKSYGISIRKKKQPVIKASVNGSKFNKQSNQAILIPQFLLMSGVPDNFDERKRRQISEFTIINPDQKLKKIQSLIRNINNQSQNFSPNSISETFGIKFNKQSQTVDATILPTPTIQLGKGQMIEKSKAANFQLFSKQIYKHDIPLCIVVFIPQSFDFSPIQRLFSSTAKNLCLKHKFNLIRLNYDDTKKVMQDIEKFIFDKDRRYDDFDLNWFIIPPQMKCQYKTIKRLSLKKENPKSTQVTLTSSLEKKGFASVLTKILIQISAKLGNIPWAPKLPSNIPRHTILMGIDTCKQGKNKLVAYCSTLDQEMSKFHSNYFMQDSSNQYIAKMGDLLSDCLIAYQDLNRVLPQQIIILKADISDGEKQSFIQGQINQLKAKIKNMNGYSPKLTWISVNKRSKHKFFLEGRTLMNPGFGTLINNKVVSKNYDFFLIAQHCNRGTVKPIHYKVLYTDSKIEQGVLQQLMYVQSFNYMNWSGSVRVPGVLQYSTKLATFISEYINTLPETKNLNQHLYFI